MYIRILIPLSVSSGSYGRKYLEMWAEHVKYVMFVAFCTSDNATTWVILNAFYIVQANTQSVKCSALTKIETLFPIARKSSPMALNYSIKTLKFCGRGRHYNYTPNTSTCSSKHPSRRRRINSILTSSSPDHLTRDVLFNACHFQAQSIIPYVYPENGSKSCYEEPIILRCYRRTWGTESLDIIRNSTLQALVVL